MLNDVSVRFGPMQSSGQVPLPALTGDPTQISWATRIRAEVSLSFDRVIIAIQTGTNKYKGLEPSETEKLLFLVEEHRADVLGVPEAQYFLDHWQDPVDRVQRLIHGDARWRVIIEAKAARNPRHDAPVTLRYMGFDDAAGVRIFKFGRLPAAPDTPVFAVHADVSLFLKHKISFQDGPSLCSAIVSFNEREKHLLTDEDCLNFISLRPVKADRKAPKRKPAIPPDA